MDSMSALLPAEHTQPKGWLIVLVYAGLVVAGNALILAFDWPYAFVPILCVPIVPIALYYPRRVYFSMWIIWIAASVGVSYRLATDFFLSATGIILGGLAFLVLLELVHVIVSTRRRTEQTLKQRDREVAALMDVTATISATLELDQVLQRLVDTVVASFPEVTSATFQLVQEQDGALRTVAASEGISARASRHPVIFRSGEGIAGQAMAQRSTINVTDVASTPGYLPGEVPPAYRSLLVIPLVVGARVWGTLSLAGKATSAFDARDIRLLESLAQQAAIAVENAHLYQETVRRVQEQATVASVVRALNASLDVEQAFPAVVEGLQLLTACDRVSMVLLDAENEEFIVAALNTAVPGLEQDRTFPYSATASIPDLLTGRAHLTQDLTTESEYPIRQLLIQAGYRSAVNLPLVASDDVIGALNLGSKRESAFNQGQIPLLQQIADALAAALVKSDLFNRLRAAEAQYRGLFENSADPIAILDPDGTLLDVNPAACEVTGRTRDELMGQNIGAIDDVPEKAFRNSIAKALRGDDVYYEFSALVRGKMRHFEASLQRVDQTEETALQWVAHDVTARRELDHWREELTGITVHNLRNPLTWIQTGTEAALMLLPEDADPGIPFALDKALKGVARLQQQIDLLLNINRAEAGQELTDTEPVAPQALIADVIDLLTPRAAARGIQLLTDFPDALPHVLGNRHMLSWTLENLVDNAIKFNAENEVVIIRARVNSESRSSQHKVGAGEPQQATLPHHISDRGTEAGILGISVVDRGPGVPIGEQERIFHKFFQVRRPEGSKGAGMGLYFCKLAVEAHGGRIWVENNDDGRGCTFSFTLPL
jgi:NtrC-family two-component system sensor histidine kinase KinB